MSYEATWYHEKRVILVRIEGNLSQEDARVYSDDIYQMMDEGIAPTHVIADLTKIGEFPHSLISLKNAARYLEHPKIGRIVVIGGPLLAQVFAGVLTRVARINYRSAQTVEEAIQLLVEDDATLADMENRSR